MKDHPGQSRQYAFQGFLLGSLPSTILAVYADPPWLHGIWEMIFPVAATVLLLAGTALIFQYRILAKSMIGAGVLLHLGVLYSELLKDPLLALFCLLLALGAFYYLLTARLYPAQKTGPALQLERVIGCSAAGVLLSMLSPLFTEQIRFFSPICAVNMFMTLILIWKYCRENRYWQQTKKILFLLGSAGILLGVLFRHQINILPLFLTAPVILILALRQKHVNLKYLELVMIHPARCLFLTFLALCITGTLLLRTPWSVNGELSVLDAAFTAVSAVCVTGLTVIDISSSLTVSGQFFLMILIQLGGLGIMTLTTLVLHSVGNLSLNGERLITELTQSDDQDVFESLRLIVRFTFIVEFTGAILLTCGFFMAHGNFLLAFRQGVFTSVSAFCNAGFFPGSYNLVPYAGESLLLTVIALEIITGGIAPAVIWSALKVRRYHQIPMVCRIVLGTTAILVLSGTFLLLLFEWNGIFRELPWYDKLVNSFFQSVTLRTAGFNTVPFSELGFPAYMVMIILMFIGGSPGGTAGGIKTTTLAVLTGTFQAAVRSKNTVTMGQYRLEWNSIIQAVAVFMSALLILLVTVMMLVTTQSLDAGKLIFEAVSALATVGLSLNCTGELDEVGRIIVMMAMFIGRIGPLTLFCMLSESRNDPQINYPKIKIPLG